MIVDKEEKPYCVCSVCKLNLPIYFKFDVPNMKVNLICFDCLIDSKLDKNELNEFKKNNIMRLKDECLKEFSFFSSFKTLMDAHSEVIENINKEINKSDKNNKIDSFKNDLENFKDEVANFIHSDLYSIYKVQKDRVNKGLKISSNIAKLSDLNNEFNEALNDNESLLKFINRCSEQSNSSDINIKNYISEVKSTNNQILEFQQMQLKSKGKEEEKLPLNLSNELDLCMTNLKNVFEKIKAYYKKLEANEFKNPGNVGIKANPIQVQDIPNNILAMNHRSQDFSLSQNHSSNHSMNNNNNDEKLKIPIEATSIINSNSNGFNHHQNNDNCYNLLGSNNVFPNLYSQNQNHNHNNEQNQSINKLSNNNNMNSASNTMKIRYVVYLENNAKIFKIKYYNVHSKAFKEKELTSELRNFKEQVLSNYSDLRYINIVNGIFCTGGYIKKVDTGSINSKQSFIVSILDDSNCEIQPYKEMIEGRRRHNLQFINYKDKNYIFCMSGLKTKTCEFTELDSMSDWQRFSDLNNVRSNGTSFYLNGKIWIFGGFSQDEGRNENYYDDIESVSVNDILTNPMGCRWIKFSIKPNNYLNKCAFSVLHLENNSMLVCGGFNGEFFPDIYVVNWNDEDNAFKVCEYNAKLPEKSFFLNSNFIHGEDKCSYAFSYTGVLFKYESNGKFSLINHLIE